MGYILAIETSTTVCSVALLNENKIVAARSINNGYTHAENLATFVKECLMDARIKVNQLDAIAVGKGPGSYTGLRIGVSMAKGLCYSHKLPLIGVSTLKAMALQAIELIGDKNAYYCPMIDARRMEVYNSVFDFSNNIIGETKATIVDQNSFNEYINKQTVYFFGNGAAKCKDVLTHENAQFNYDIVPSANYIAKLAFQKHLSEEYEDVAYFEPHYLKDFVATTPKKLV